jgi:hypothetical protein
MNDIEKPDVIGATRRAETIRIGMVGWAAAQDAIAEAFEAKDWITLGYKSWGEYVEKEFAEKRLKLTRDQRSEAVEVFRLVGMSQREIAATLDVSRNTVAKDVAQSEPPADPLDQFPDAKDAIDASVANRSTPADEPEEDHRDASPGDAAEGEVPVVPAEPSRDETEADDAASQQSSAEVAERQQERAGVSAPAAALERSGGNEEQGQAAASVPAPVDDEEKRLLDWRRGVSRDFMQALVDGHMRLQPDPVEWLRTVYLPGSYPDRNMPRVRDCFTPEAIRTTAQYLFEVAEYMEANGVEL